MIERTVMSSKICLKTGAVVEVTLLSGITTDDLLIQGMKAEGYRVITKKDVFPSVGRDLRDYLVRTGIVT